MNGNKPIMYNTLAPWLLPRLAVKDLVRTAYRHIRARHYVQATELAMYLEQARNEKALATEIRSDIFSHAYDTVPKKPLGITVTVTRS